MRCICFETQRIAYLLCTQSRDRRYEITPFQMILAVGRLMLLSYCKPFIYVLTTPFMRLIILTLY